MQNRTSIFEIDDFSLGRKFGMLGKMFHSVLAKKLRHLSIERHFSILIILDKMGSNSTQKLFADIMHIDKAAMIGVLDNLVENGFIRRTRNPNDRREHWIQLTNKGEKHIPEIKMTVKELNSLVLKGIRPIEVSRLQKYLEIIYGNISAEINNLNNYNFK